jgi:putative acetyltransferase
MVDVRELQESDIDSALRLWAAVEGLGSGPGDANADVSRFIERNPGLSVVATHGREVVGALLCGHDGRRGFIYRLAVAGPYRRKNLASRMVRRCLVELAARGVPRCMVFVLDENDAASRFWESIGGRLRRDLRVFSVDTHTKTRT